MRIRLHTSRRRGKQRQLRRWVLLAGSVCALLFCVFGLARYFLNARRSALIAQTFQELYYSETERQEEQQALAQRSPILKQFEVSFVRAAAENDIAAPTEKPIVSAWPGNPSMTISPSLKKLRQQNKDIVGWLILPDSLGQAVVQRDNEYYLKRDYLGYHNANGALFLEESISLKTRPDTYIIFGHNMKTGDMFGAKFCYDTIPNELDVFDKETYENSNTFFFHRLENLLSNKRMILFENINPPRQLSIYKNVLQYYCYYVSTAK